jgi:hypothetical protein
LPALAEREKAGLVSASSDLAELSTLRSQLEDLARRVEAVADRYEDTADSQIASDLYAAERTLISARRAVDKAISALGDLAR